MSTSAELTKSHALSPEFTAELAANLASNWATLASTDNMGASAAGVLLIVLKSKNKTSNSRENGTVMTDHMGRIGYRNVRFESSCQTL